jgi:hypothetical protein
VLVDPIDPGEVAAAGVVVDVDERPIFVKSKQTSASDAVALEQDGWNAVVGYIGCRGSVVDAANVRQRAVDRRDWICEDNICLAAKLIEDLG